MKVRYTTTIDHLMALHHHHARKSPAMWVRKYIAPAIVVALVFAAMYRVSSVEPVRRPASDYYKFGAGFSALFLLFNWLGIKASDWSVKRMYQKGGNKSVLCEHTLELTDDGILERTALGESRNVWAAIEAVDRTYEFIFIYVQANAAHIVPVRSLAEGDADAFHKELLARVAAGSLRAKETA